MNPARITLEGRPDLCSCVSHRRTNGERDPPHPRAAHRATIRLHGSAQGPARHDACAAKPRHGAGRGSARRASGPSRLNAGQTLPSRQGASPLPTPLRPTRRRHPPHYVEGVRCRSRRALRAGFAPHPCYAGDSPPTTAAHPLALLGGHRDGGINRRASFVRCAHKSCHAACVLPSHFLTRLRLVRAFALVP